MPIAPKFLETEAVDDFGLDPTLIAAAVREMSAGELQLMERVCGTDPVAICQYLIDRFGFSGLHELAAKRYVGLDLTYAYRS